MCWITFIDLRILKNPCIPGIKPTWSWCMIFLMCCWILIAEFCWVFLHLCSSVISACNFPFLWYRCLVLISGWWWPHRLSLGVFLPLQFFRTVWAEIGVSSSLRQQHFKGMNIACKRAVPLLDSRLYLHVHSQNSFQNWAPNVLCSQKYPYAKIKFFHSKMRCFPFFI